MPSIAFRLVKLAAGHVCVCVCVESRLTPYPRAAAGAETVILGGIEWYCASSTSAERWPE
jgi:hypothetical protein